VLLERPRFKLLRSRDAVFPLWLAAHRSPLIAAHAAPQAKSRVTRAAAQSPGWAYRSSLELAALLDHERHASGEAIHRMLQRRLQRIAAQLDDVRPRGDLNALLESSRQPGLLAAALDLGPTAASMR